MDKEYRRLGNEGLKVGLLSEVIMGQVARELGWPRESYVMSTKLYWGLQGAGRSAP